MSDQSSAPLPKSERRRALRVALIAALSTFVLVLPVAVFLLLRGGGKPAEPAAPPSPGITSPSTTPSSGPQTSRPPDGRIPLSTLKNATLTIPRWPADNVQGPHGPLQFRDGKVTIPFEQPVTGRPPTGTEIVILAVTYGDVDRDGADETIAEIGCLVEGGSKQLVAFDRDTSGRIVTMGAVVATTGDIRDIRTDSARVTGNGTVTAKVGDYLACCGDETPRTWQTRGYRWRNGGFEQVSGPTTMTANPYVTETRISAGSLVLGPAVDGYRSGIVTVTMTHRWGTRPERLTLRFFPSAGLERAGSAWPPVSANSVSFAVTMDAPRAGSSVTRTFAFRRPAATSGGQLDIELLGNSRQDRALSEAVPWNNTAIAAIRTAY